MKRNKYYLIAVLSLFFLMTGCKPDPRDTKAEKEATKVKENDTTNLRKEKEGSLGHRFMEPDSL